jgi:hypothetical protein
MIVVTLSFVDTDLTADFARREQHRVDIGVP